MMLLQTMRLAYTAVGLGGKGGGIESFPGLIPSFSILHNNIPVYVEKTGEPGGKAIVVSIYNVM